MPLLITEFGVPSSIGTAHHGTNGRDQGEHSEQEALAIDAASCGSSRTWASPVR